MADIFKKVSFLAAPFAMYGPIVGDQIEQYNPHDQACSI